MSEKITTQRTIGTKQPFTAPSIAVGCMRINGLEKKEIAQFVDGCLEMGLTYFDHADIYGRGECEKLFGEALKGQ